MRKYLAVAAVVVLVAFAAPAFAAVNPFIDVPSSHWAYDAIGQLAARGILSGYPDGTYKGTQPTTRFEMASALARTLVLVDMSKASKQDVELLKKLVVEFKDELDAFGVRIDSLDERFGRMERRLGGWRISGQLRQDITYQTKRAVLRNGIWRNENQSFAPLARARLFLERWFGPDESVHFWARIDGQNSPFRSGNSGGSIPVSNTSVEDRAMRFSRYQVTVPFGTEGRIRVGRQTFDDLEAPYYLDIGTPFSKFMSGGNDTVLYDRPLNSVRLDKNFGGMSSLTFIVGNEHLSDIQSAVNAAIKSNNVSVDELKAWMATLHAKGQFTERWGLDVGINAYLFDNTGKRRGTGTTTSPENNPHYNFKNLWTAYGGLRFDFTPAIAIRGVYHYQSFKGNTNYFDGTKWNRIDWEGFGESANKPSNWKVILDVKQDLLKFTSLWLEYNHVDQYFWVPVGAQYLFHDGDFMHETKVGGKRGAGVYSNGMLNYDTNIWRIAAQQEWNNKWTTYLFYENVTLRNVLNLSGSGAVRRNEKFDHYGVGFVYQYNPNVGFGLTYQGINYNRGLNEAWATNKNESMVRFRTHVAF